MTGLWSDTDTQPERVVHARGAGAFGEFKLHTPLTGITTAKILTDTSKTTPAYVRFSTVNGSRGSGDTVCQDLAEVAKILISRSVILEVLPLDSTPMKVIGISVSLISMYMTSC
jgi:hypothetical protein